MSSEIEILTDEFNLTPAEASEILHVSPQTLRYYEKEGRLRSQRTQGGHRRYSDTDVEDLRNFQKTGEKILGKSNAKDVDNKTGTIPSEDALEKSIDLFQKGLEQEKKNLGITEYQEAAAKAFKIELDLDVDPKDLITKKVRRSVPESLTKRSFYVCYLKLDTGGPFGYLAVHPELLGIQYTTFIDGPKNPYYTFDREENSYSRYYKIDSLEEIPLAMSKDRASRIDGLAFVYLFGAMFSLVILGVLEAAFGGLGLLAGALVILIARVVYVNMLLPTRSNGRKEIKEFLKKNNVNAKMAPSIEEQASSPSMSHM